MDESGHDWQRTIPTDGEWCVRCGLSAARWTGERCPGTGAVEALEALLVQARERIRELEAALESPA